MSTIVWYLFMLVPVLAIAYIIWAYRQRTAEREARSRERYVSLSGVAHGAAATRSPQSAPAAAAPAAPPVAAARPVSLLTQPETLWYYVLKAGLPDHEVFPRVSLASVLGAPAGGSAPALDPQRRLGHHLDFVVCDKSMRVVAAIVMERGAGAESLSRSLASTGIRLITVSASALPRREQVRALIYGPQS